ncbi:hypothetical protein V6N12_072955 [Hibiscus sabdariffa]|uniref:Uncharacterized protein n=1 Tax=Hibiscus sabdariffa TaxID=183260 RepID=A0ABR2B4N2_9ROSI
MFFCVSVRFGNSECGGCCCLWETRFNHLQVGNLDVDRLNKLCSCMNWEVAYGSIALWRCYCDLSSS